jgi:hypothetical protein
MGGLFYPAQDLFILLKYFHTHLNSISKDVMVDRIVNMACQKFATTLFRDHTDLVELRKTPHEIKLIKMIGYFFFKIILHHKSKINTVTQNPSSTGLRQKLHKLELFKNT